MRNLFSFALFLPVLIPSLTAAASTCPLENMFCESFETSSITGSYDGSSEAKISTVRAYDGKHALHVVGAGGGYNRQFFKVPLSETPFAKRHFGRAMVWLSDRNAADADFTLLQLAGPATTQSGAPEGFEVALRGRVDGRYDHLFSNYDTYPVTDNSAGKKWSTDCWQHPAFSDTKPPASTYRVPKNQWFCLAWFVDVERDNLAFWLDGKPLEEITVNGKGQGCVAHSQADKWLAPSELTYLGIGIEQYQKTAKRRELFIDDIALSQSPVPCPVLQAPMAGGEVVH
ncbi:hypothetical protein [Teredinibacter turnerae]|uniref:hypothetical protein n=1 Tax=Teredinibacter turnerae TaxID=2426 RepID=UPI0030CE672D